MAGPDEISDERLKRILDIWNARINPPDRPSAVGEIDFSGVQGRNELDERNRKVEELNKYEKGSDDYSKAVDSISRTDKNTEWPVHKLNLDPTKPYSMEDILNIQKSLATDSFKEYTPIEAGKGEKYVHRLAREIDRKRVEAGHP